MLCVCLSFVAGSTVAFAVQLWAVGACVGLCGSGVGGGAGWCVWFAVADLMIVVVTAAARVPVFGVCKLSVSRLRR